MIDAGPSGVLLVDDEPYNVAMIADVLRGLDLGPVRVVHSVTEALDALHARAWLLVVMDIFIPLGEHPQRALGVRAASLQGAVEHLGGLLLLDEIDRLAEPPRVLAHTACTERALLDVIAGRVVGRIRKGAPLDAVLRDILDAARR
jgi:CheY-like chemotaxis protein